MSPLLIVVGVVFAMVGASEAQRVAPRPLISNADSTAAIESVLERVTGVLPSMAHASVRDVALAAVASLSIALVIPPAVVIGPLVVVGVAVRRARAAGATRIRAIAHSLPEMIDHLGVAVGAGLPLPAALDITRRWLPAELAELVGAALDRFDAGAPLIDVLTHLRDGLPAPARRPLVVVIAATRDGAPLRPSLERAAAEARLARRRTAEVRARRLPVLMLLPLVLCVLPAFVLLTLVPLVIGSLDGLSLSDAFPAP